MKNWEAQPHPGKEGCVVTSYSVSAVDPENWPMVIWGPAQGYALGQSMALAKDKETADLIVAAVNERESMRTALIRCFSFMDKGNAPECWSQCPVCRANCVHVGPNRGPLVHTPECWYGQAIKEKK